MTIKTLLVVWRDEVSKLYFHIGTLAYNGDVYTFEYTHHHKDAKRKVFEAKNYGYQLHPAFPNLKKKYESKQLFTTFNRRIPSKKRVNYNEVLEELNLPMDADRMDILSRTRGMLANNPYFFENPLILNKESVLSASFYINGMRYNKELPTNWSQIIRPNETLEITREKNNEHDPFAVKVESKKGFSLGYIPGIYAQAIASLIDRKILCNINVKKIRPSYVPQLWIEVDFKASLDNVQQIDRFPEFEGLYRSELVA